jgi:hypothetical protein
MRAPLETLSSALLLVAATAPGPLAAQQIVRLPSGDSVTILSAGPAMAPNGPVGLLVRFAPFDPAFDSVKVEEQARRLFQVYLGKIDSSGINLLVLQALPRPSAARRDLLPLRGYRLVFRKHPDGRWYLDDEASPIDRY